MPTKCSIRQKHRQRRLRTNQRRLKPVPIKCSIRQNRRQRRLRTNQRRSKPVPTKCSIRQKHRQRPLRTNRRQSKPAPTKCSIRGKHRQRPLRTSRRRVEAAADQVLDTTKAPPTPPPYKPTAQEQVYLARQERREGSTPPAPRLNFAHDHRGMRLMTDHPDPTIVKLIMETLGTADPAFFAGLKQQLIDLRAARAKKK